MINFNESETVQNEAEEEYDYMKEEPEVENEYEEQEDTYCD